MKPTILIFSQAMELGGVERSLLGLLDSIDYDRYDVDLFLMRHSGELMPYLNPRANLLPEIPQYVSLAVLDEVLCNVEYQPDGSSNNMFRQYWKNPRGFAFWRTVKMQYPESFQRLVMDCIHYCSSSQIAGNRNYIRESPKKLLTVACTPLGWMLTGWIRRKVKE